MRKLARRLADRFSPGGGVGGTGAVAALLARFDPAEPAFPGRRLAARLPAAATSLLTGCLHGSRSAVRAAPGYNAGNPKSLAGSRPEAGGGLVAAGSASA